MKPPKNIYGPIVIAVIFIATATFFVLAMTITQTILEHYAA